MGSEIDIRVTIGGWDFGGEVEHTYLELETGDTDRLANYESYSGRSVVYKYAVQAGDVSSDLNYEDRDSLYWTLPSPARNIHDAAGDEIQCVLWPTNSPNALAQQGDIVIDGIAPTVSSVSSPNASGTYGPGDMIAVNVTFSEAVTVNATSGTPSIGLETGATDRSAAYTSGNGTTSLLFAYTVADGDAASDLGYTGRSALSLNGGTIKDGAGNALSTTDALPAAGASGTFSLGSGIAVETSTTILSVTSPDDDGTYGTGATINITVRFSGPVSFSPSSASPYLELDTGNADAANRRAICTPAGSASAVLACEYTVRRGDATADLGYGAGSSLALDGATATDAAGRSLLTGLPDSPAEDTLRGSKEIALDTSVPEVLRVTSPDANGTYGRGETVRIDVVFDGAVTIDPEPAVGGSSAPTLRLATGENDRTALYSGRNGADKLRFEYTVRAGDFSADLNYTGTGALSLGAGAGLVDEYGNEDRNQPVLPDPGSANSLGGQKDIAVRTVPTVEGVSANYTAGTFLKVGQTLGVRVQFSEKVSVAPAANGSVPSIGLDTGRAEGGSAAYSGGSGMHTLLFAYPVHPADSKAVLDYGTDALKLNGATIRGAGAGASLTLPAPGSDGSLASARIELRPNEPPAIGPPGNRSVGVGTELRVGVTAVDPEGQPLTFSLVAPAPDGASIEATSPEAALLTWTPTEQQRTALGPANSTYTVTVRASDPHMANDTARFAVTVVETRPEGYAGPSIGAIPDVTGREGEPIRFAVNASGNGTLVYSLAVDADPRPPAGAAVHPNGTFAWVPGYDQSGTHTITVRVADRFALDDTGAFTVVVLDAEPPWNEPPVFEPIDPHNADEGKTLTVTVTASDSDGPVAYSLAGEPPAGSAIDPATGVFTWSIGYDQAGAHNITVAAADRYNRTSTITFAVAVADVDPPNEPPAIAPIPEQRVTAGSALELQVNATDPNEGDILAFDLADPPPGAAITAGGLFTWTPGREHVGQNALNVTVTDDRGLLAWAPLAVTVVDPPAAAASAEAVFAGPRTVRIDYTAPLGPPAGRAGAVYGGVSIGDGGAASAEPASVSGLGTHTHIVRLDGDAAGRGQNGTIRLLADLEGAANGTLYAFTDDSIPVRAGEVARTLSPPGAAAPVVAIERDGFVRAVNATAASDAARPAINVTSLAAAGGTPARGTWTVTMPNETVSVIASFAEVAFPPDVTAMSVPSDGLLELYVSAERPTAQQVADALGEPAAGLEVLTVVEVGDSATRIAFSMPVRILLVGQASGYAFYVNGTGGGATVVPIAAECAVDDTFAAAHARLGGSGECWLDSGADKVIYTYHLTRFGAANIPPDMCAADIESDTIKFGPVAAGGQSDARAQRITNAGALPMAAVSISATDWTREGGGGAAMPANATQVRAGGTGGWTPLEGEFPAALGADGQSASVQFRLAVPEDALGGGASSVPVLQAITYTVECAAPAR